MSSVASEHAQMGFSKVPEPVTRELLVELENLFPSSGPGKRVLGSDPLIKVSPLIQHMLELASEILQEPTVPVRAIFFLKSQENNWLVPWHQDVTMASPQKFEREGYRSWTLKEGIWHVQPPDTVLSKMVALRLHLDPCSAHDGPLRVIPATHLAGRLSAEAIDTYVEQTQPAILLADKGEILAMAPLLCHSSGKATGTSQRRVLHVEFCAKSVCPPEIFA